MTLLFPLDLVPPYPTPFAPCRYVAPFSRSQGGGFHHPPPHFVFGSDPLRPTVQGLTSKHLSVSYQVKGTFTVFSQLPEIFRYRPLSSDASSSTLGGIRVECDPLSDTQAENSAEQDQHTGNLLD